jgi:hypothetical protein
LAGNATQNPNSVAPKWKHLKMGVGWIPEGFTETFAGHMGSTFCDVTGVSHIQFASQDENTNQAGREA